MKQITLAFSVLLFSITLTAQTVSNKRTTRRCGTMEVLNEKLKDPSFKEAFEKNQERLYANVTAAKTMNAQINDTIAVVVHIITSNASIVTNAVVQSQIDVLNEDFKGLNADSTRIPAAFKPLFGKSNLHFMLAQTDENGLPTTGIERRNNSKTFNIGNYADAKYYNKGGLDAWDPNKYFNVWVVTFTDGTLGVSVFPGDPAPIDEHGYLCDYRNFGRGAAYLDPDFNKGRTATHEIGHFFNLYHIWGDDGGSCSQSDFRGTLSWDDTPNQGDASFGNPDFSGSGTVKTDNCSPVAPGIMYQNFMDYSDDIALVMFTKGQWKRMEQALLNAPDRKNLLLSTAYNPPVSVNHDAGLTHILYNGKNLKKNTEINICHAAADFSVKLYNYGMNNLNSAGIYLELNNNAPVLVQSWTGNLAQYSFIDIPLGTINFVSGLNTIRIYSHLPNGTNDQNNINDTTDKIMVYYNPLTASTLPVLQEFESAFPSAGWNIVNPDNNKTWAKTTQSAKSGSGSAFMDNFNYNNSYGQEDILVLPMINASLLNFDSLFITYDYAYRQYSSLYMDELQIVVSTDCGNSWTSVSTKKGSALATVTGYQTSSFKPTSSQWKADKVNLSAFIGQNIMVGFRNISDWGQNVYIDNVNLYAVAKSTVPLKLVQFEGSRYSEFFNQLKWITSEELNVAYYEIQFSADGKEYFVVNKIDAHNKSSNQYSYLDEIKSNVSYYRLKMVDKDGKYSFSDVISIKSNTENEISAYPNPAKNNLNIRFTAKAGKTITIKIVDVMGRQVALKSIIASAEWNTHSIDVSSLKKGIYILEVSGEVQKQIKFIKD